MTNLTLFDGTMDTDPQIALICPGKKERIQILYTECINFK